MAATTDFWTTALPVIGTLGGALIATTSTLYATGRRDRKDRLEGYRVEQRTAIIAVLRLVQVWSRVGAMVEAFSNATTNAKEIIQSQELTQHAEQYAELNSAIIEAQVIVQSSDLTWELLKLSSLLGNYPSKLYVIQENSANRRFESKDQQKKQSLLNSCANSRRLILETAEGLRSMAAVILRPPIAHRHLSWMKLRKIRRERPLAPTGS